MNLKTKIKIFETGIEEGIFSMNPKFYPSYYSENEIKTHFLEVKRKIANKYNFDEKKIIQPQQKNENNKLNYPNGKYHILNTNNISKEDYWDEKIPTDILILKEEKGVVLGNQMADCPILIVEDREQGVTAISHCGASYIDRRLPIDTINALIKEFNSKKDNLFVYVGSCAKKENYIYDKYPLWAKNKELWKENIILKEDGYHIDMNGAIRKQLEDIGVYNIYESPVDTITNEKYYSHCASKKGETYKKGQNFVGFFYI